VSKSIPIIELDSSQLAGLLQRIQSQVDVEDFQLIEQLIGSLEQLLELIDKGRLSIQRLRQMLFGSRSEKTNTIRGTKSDPKRKPDKPPGHGRKGAKDYLSAQQVSLSIAGLNPKDPCPECEQGKLYAMKPGVLIRIKGQPLFPATLYEQQKLRCNLCSHIVSASLPPDVGEAKYDEQVGPLIGLLRYGAGMPLYRLEKLQASFGVPMPASTQWELVQQCADNFLPVYQALIVQAAQDHILYNDDTSMKVLELHQESPPPDQEKPDPKERTGVFTTGIISETTDRRIALFFTGHKHAGENLDAVLAHRQAQLPAPIQMCDGLSRNWPKNARTIRSQCILHGRRKFVEIFENFAQPCSHLLESLKKLYRHEAHTKKMAMNPAQRLSYHKRHSQSLMDALHNWMQQELDQKKVEPNSGLGQACKYMLKRWEPMTLFLRQPGAALDNNICERCLKMAILHRKNSMFYKTLNGAKVGDLFMSLIHTCSHNGVNPLEYFTQLQKNTEAVRKQPDRWLPWNYQENLEAPNTS